MARLLKNAAKDIADAFTRWNLWQGGGASALSDLNDVSINNPQANEVLQFNGSEWVNAIVQGSGNVGAQVDYITEITTSTQSIDFTSHDIYIYILTSDNNSVIVGSAIYNKEVLPKTTYIIPVNDDLRILIRGDNHIDQNPNNARCFVYGIKFAEIEPNQHEYSTTERVIGKWTDGKPLYEITIVGDTSGTNQDYKSTGLLCENISLKKIDLTIKTSDYYGFTQCRGDYFVLNDYLVVSQNITGQTLTYRYNVIVQYTKTTD